MRDELLDRGSTTDSDKLHSVLMKLVGKHTCQLEWLEKLLRDKTNSSTNSNTNSKLSRVLSVFNPKSCAKRCANVRQKFIPNLEIKKSIYAPQNTFYKLYKSVIWDHGGKNGLDEHIDVVFELIVYLTVTDIMIKYHQALVHTKFF